jgi:zinc D-Ala-D-Ala carboxypeptidase
MLAPLARAHRNRRVLAVVLLTTGVLTGCGSADGLLPSASRSAPTGDRDESAVIADGDSIPATDVDHPAIARLDRDLRQALAAATEAARSDGIELRVTSGWRSRAHQQRLFDEAVERYRDVREARRMVAEPDRSAHVHGQAVDIGPTDAAYWMQQHGARFGLCQTFAKDSAQSPQVATNERSGGVGRSSPVTV